MIIIEGFDGVGKSTLARRLQEKFNLPIYHAGGKPISAQHSRNCLATQQVLSALPIIHDRVTCISTFCYEMLFASDVGLTMINCARRLVHNSNSTIVYCEFDPQNELKTHVAKDYDTPEHIEYITKNKDAILSGYAVIRQVFEKEYPEQFIVCNAYDDDSIQQTIDTISKRPL